MLCCLDFFMYVCYFIDVRYVIRECYVVCMYVYALCVYVCMRVLFVSYLCMLCMHVWNLRVYL